MPRVELTITLSDAGQVTVTGPIEQKLICYGLLAIAKDVIAAHVPRLVEPATLVPPNGLVKGI